MRERVHSVLDYITSFEVVEQKESHVFGRGLCVGEVINDHLDDEIGLELAFIRDFVYFLFIKVLFEDVLCRLVDQFEREQFLARVVLSDLSRVAVRLQLLPLSSRPGSCSSGSSCSR